MGGSQSAPRKITINNPDDASIIKITENVVDRLQEASKQESDYEKIGNTNSSVSSNKDAVYITSQQIRRELDREIERNDLYWENRSKKLRNGFNKINTDLKEEYNKAVKEVNQSLGDHYVNINRNYMEACKQSQNSITECYNLNNKQPLLCSEEVQKFNDCVTNGMNIALKVE
ncbi:hypothetical protein PGB90_000590 [Kerria lacca]